MAKRVTTKIGDLFSAKIDDNTKKYFQLVAFDLTQLNSDVIRAFKNEYPIDATPNLSDIVNDEVAFYAHCVTKWGVKLGFWEQYGNIKEIGDPTTVIFRDTNDYGQYPGKKIVSEKWYVWKIDDPSFTRVGKLTGENRKAEIGLIINPESIVYRLRTGEYDLKFYPDFE
ncbi:hypothetical protein [Sphingobacterium sp.]|uniref:hypothetical protein n=1 Tax=Sphingobacterium sp. TaxID=341027 RepID=UPI00289ECD86|nr:hypothetical protein [Sphingobacterium sp.]